MLDAYSTYNGVASIGAGPIPRAVAGVEDPGVPGKTNRVRPTRLGRRVMVEYIYARRESVAYIERCIRETQVSRLINLFAHHTGVIPDRISVKNAPRPTRRWVRCASFVHCDCLSIPKSGTLPVWSSMPGG